MCFLQNVFFRPINRNLKMVFNDDHKTSYEFQFVQNKKLKIPFMVKYKNKSEWNRGKHFFFILNLWLEFVQCDRCADVVLLTRIHKPQSYLNLYNIWQYTNVIIKAYHRIIFRVRTVAPGDNYNEGWTGDCKNV